MHCKALWIKVAVMCINVYIMTDELKGLQSAQRLLAKGQVLQCMSAFLHYLTIRTHFQSW